MTEPSAEQVAQYSAWQAERHAHVTSPTGNLALVTYLPVPADEPVPVAMLPATIVRAPGRDGLLLTADPADGLTVDGVPVHGQAFVGRLRSDGTPLIRCGRYTADVFSLDGIDYELRIYDALADGLDNFDHIEYYPYAPELVIEGSFHAYPQTEQVSWDFTRPSDTGRTKKVPGTVAFTLDGQAYELLGFLDGDHIVLVFADTTTGSESYAGGRFLRMPRPDETGSVTVDFNRAFIPPCGFSDFYSCPIPPPQNRLATAIRAGEREVIWKRRRH